MIVKCEQCKTRFRLADEKVPPSGVRVRCARCRHVFRVYCASASQPHSYLPSASVQMAAPPPVEEDPFAFFGEPMQQTGTSEPTRPGIFLPGVEASRRGEGSKAPIVPPRVPVFGGSGGANISKLFAEKMAGSPEETMHLGASSLLGAEEGLLAETVKLSNAIETIQVEYLSSDASALQSPGDAVLGTQKVPSFSIPPSLREPLLSREREELEGDPTLEDEAPRGPARRISQELSVQEFFAPEPSAPESSSAEISDHGTLANLLSAASEDIAQDNTSELLRADESEIRRAFVQSKTKVKRRKRLQRFLKVCMYLLLATLLLSGCAVYWKEGKLLHRRPNGQVDWNKSFSWERLKKNLFSEAQEKDIAGSLYAMHLRPQADADARGITKSLPQG